MSRSAPMVIQVPHARLRRRRRVSWHILSPCRNRSEAARLIASFRFKNDEQRFARRLARTKPNLWVFRCNQTAFCGDFVVVDMSSPDPERRAVYVIDLKQGAPLKLGGGGCGVQLINAAEAVAQIALRTGVVPQAASFRRVSGDRREVSAYLSSPASELG